MKRKYKIAIDVSPLSDGNSIRGVGYYTRHLVAALQKEVKTNSQYFDFDIQLITDRLKLKANFDLIHYPFFDPFYLTLPLTTKPFIVTIHDIIPIEFRSFFPVGIKGFFKWNIQKLKLLLAKYVITVSHYSKYSIHKFTHYPLEKIFTSYEAADSSLHPVTEKKFLKNVKDKYKLPDKFVFFLGDINWNKNIRTLVKACQQLGYPLIIAGSAATKEVPKHPWTTDIHWLQDQIKNQTKKIIIPLGFVPDEDLPSVFNLATMYVQPSFAEGFGLPPLQAMQSGCPVIYSSATSLPEVMDYNGLPFDPNSLSELKTAIKTFWNDDQLRQKYIKLGLKRASTFTWQQTALNTLSVYRLALLDEKK